MSVLKKRSIIECIKKPLRKIKTSFIDRYRKRILVKLMQKKHTQLIQQLKTKEKIKVVFLAVHKSVWKVDAVYRQMLNDPYFDPEILVCPYIQYGEEQMQRDMDEAYNYFKDKGYQVRKSQKEIDSTWVSLDEIKPDIVFFTNPHKLTRSDYFDHAFKNYLSCYVPYYYMATNHAGNEEAQLNTLMMNSMWRIYWPHQYIHEQYIKYSQTRGNNSSLVGYPATEELLKPSAQESSSCVWKLQECTKKRIIYAPHHTISEDNLSLSTFLKFGEAIKEMAKKYQNTVQWSFKPHPILKTKLYLHPSWGKQRTDDYYNFWKDQSYTQLDEGSYEKLFTQSDAIVHDCSSFIVEYAFTKKPALYLFNKDIKSEGFLNDFGRDVLKTYYRAATVSGISNFIDRVVGESNFSQKCSDNTFDDYLVKFYGSVLPSTKIVEDIKTGLGVSHA